MVNKKKSEKKQLKTKKISNLDILLTKTAIIIFTIICLKIALSYKLIFNAVSSFLEITMQLIVNFFNVDVYYFVLILILLLIKPIISQIKN